MVSVISWWSRGLVLSDPMKPKLSVRAVCSLQWVISSMPNTLADKWDCCWRVHGEHEVRSIVDIHLCNSAPIINVCKSKWFFLTALFRTDTGRVQGKLSPTQESQSMCTTSNNTRWPGSGSLAILCSKPEWSTHTTSLTVIIETHLMLRDKWRQLWRNWENPRNYFVNCIYFTRRRI